MGRLHVTLLYAEVDTEAEMEDITSSLIATNPDILDREYLEDDVEP